MIVTYDDAVLRRLAEQQRQAPFADDVIRRGDAKLSTLFINDSHLWDADHLVDAQVSTDGLSPSW